MLNLLIHPFHILIITSISHAVAILFVCRIYSSERLHTHTHCLISLLVLWTLTQAYITRDAYSFLFTISSSNFTITVKLLLRFLFKLVHYIHLLLSLFSSVSFSSSWSRVCHNTTTYFCYCRLAMLQPSRRIFLQQHKTHMTRKKAYYNHAYKSWKITALSHDQQQQSRHKL